MSTAVTSSEPVAPGAGAFRLLPIAADLLPPEIVAARVTRRVRRLALTIIGTLVALMVAWFGLASYRTSTARDDLAAAQDSIQSLSRQQREYDTLVSTQAASQAIDRQLASLLAQDVQWAELLASVQRAAPPGVRLTRVAAVLAENKPDAAGQAARLPNTSGQRLIGQLTLSGSGPSKAAVARYVDDLGKIPELGNPLLGDVVLTEGVLDFTVQLDITSEALGGRFTPTAPAQPTPTTPKGN